MQHDLAHTAYPPELRDSVAQRHAATASLEETAIRGNLKNRGRLVPYN